MWVNPEGNETFQLRLLLLYQSAYKELQINTEQEGTEKRSSLVQFAS